MTFKPGPKQDCQFRVADLDEARDCSRRLSARPTLRIAFHATSCTDSVAKPIFTPIPIPGADLGDKATDRLNDLPALVQFHAGQRNDRQLPCRFRPQWN